MVSPRRATRPIVAIYPIGAIPSVGCGVRYPCGARRQRPCHRSWPYPCRRECEAQSRRSGGQAPTHQAEEDDGPAGPRRSSRSCWWSASSSVLLGALAFFVLYRSIDIPDPNEAFKAQTTFVYYSGGKQELGTFTTTRTASPSRSREMPQQMQDAVVAAEDQTFWTDQGIDPKGILRAAFSNARGNDRQGASTITQQYVKILYLTSEQSYQRKIKEAIVSLKIQNELSKSEILEGYLNTIYFGRGAYGVQAAAQAFFDKDAAQLNLRESAVLATVLNNPSRYDPDGGKEAREALKERYTYVLDGDGRHRRDHRASRPRRPPSGCRSSPTSRRRASTAARRGHMLALVKQELLATGDFTEEQIDGGGLRITTTFTPEAMEAVEQGGHRAAARRATSSCTSAPPPSRSAPARCAASTAARTTSTPRSTGRSRAAWPDRRSRRRTDVAAIRDGLLPQRHLRGQQPDRHRAAPSSRTRATPTTARPSRCSTPPRTPSTPPSSTWSTPCPTARTKVIQALEDMGVPGNKPGPWGIPTAPSTCRPTSASPWAPPR